MVLKKMNAYEREHCQSYKESPFHISESINLCFYAIKQTSKHAFTVRHNGCFAAQDRIIQVFKDMRIVSSLYDPH